tara:strand:+ start:62 stop:505 length:444 start_codon:yes stop_codon:yes gene_type:complete
MLQQIAYIAVSLVLFVLFYRYISNLYNIKENLETQDSKSQKQKQQQQQQEQVDKERANATPAQINANNVTYLQRTYSDIQRSINDVKDMLSQTIQNLKDGCCDINKYNKVMMCARSGGKNLPDCKSKDPCRPCDKNDKQPSACCPKI